MFISAQLFSELNITFCKLSEIHPQKLYLHALIYSVNTKQEIKNMEIRNFTPSNNNTSFGMAFRQPKQMNEFADYVTCAAKHRLAKRGLKQFIKEQAKNDHFDVEFVPGNACDGFKGLKEYGSFKVIPTSDEAKKIMPKETMVRASAGEKVTRLSQLSDEFARVAEEETPHGLKAYLFVAKYVAKTAATIGKMLLSPKEFLPASMREAGELATKMNCKVEAKLTKRAEIADTFKPQVIKFKKSDVPTEV